MESKEIIEEIKQDFKKHQEDCKQIEDMAKDYYGYSIDLEDDCKFVAEEMFNKGHRKLSEDSVVLTKKEHTQLLSTLNRLKQYDEQRDIALHQRLINEAGKEKALEIYIWFKNIFMSNETFDRGVFGWTTDDLMVILDIFAKQFNIEVENARI